MPKIHVADRVASMRSRLSGNSHGLEGCAPVNPKAEFGDADPYTALTAALKEKVKQLANDD